MYYINHVVILDLSTNLNEDSDHQKENVTPNKRFRIVTDEETGVFKSICLILNPIKQLLLVLFCLYIYVILTQYVYTKTHKRTTQKS
jgi:hypothetical protein